MTRRLSALGALTVFLSIAGAHGDDAVGTLYADKIFTGGVIIMMQPAHPIAEAIAVATGRIIAAGSHDEVMLLKGDHTEVVDLAGKMFVLGVLGRNAPDAEQWPEPPLLAPPPAGAVFSIADIIAMIRAYINEHRIPEGTPIVARGYDDAELAEHRHPTRHDLDRISTRHPVLIVHASGSRFVANTLALDRVDYTGPAPDSGGLVRHEVSDGP